MKKQRFFNISLFRALRRRHQLTQQKVADALGVNVESISSWESGKRLPHEHQLDKIGTFFKVDPAIFLSRGQRLAWENYQLWLVKESNKALTVDELKAKDSARRDVQLLNAVPGIVEVDVMPADAENLDVSLVKADAKKKKDKTRD